MENIGIEERIVNKLTKALFENEDSINLFFAYKDAEGLKDFLSEYVQEAFDEEDREKEQEIVRKVDCLFEKSKDQENEIAEMKKSIFEIEKSIDLLISKEIEKIKRDIDKLGNIL